MNRFVKLMILSVTAFMVISVRNDAAAKKKTEVMVAAAANLSEIFKEIARIYEKETNVKVNLVFSSSGNLSKQIENGAPFDVFAAANEKFVDDLVKKGYILPDSRKLYAVGRTVLAVKKGTKFKINNLNDLTDPKIKKISIAQPEIAPYGQAAKEALYASGLWDKISDKMVYSSDIQNSLTLIMSGNAEAGFISLSIAYPSKVDFIVIDQKLHKPLKQAVGAIKTAKNINEAYEFIKFLKSKKCRKLFEKYCFYVPEE